MKKTYFLSDAHLGSRTIADGRTHERRLVDFLDRIKGDAEAIYLLGDMFDFWYEYKIVVPKGYVRFLGKLAELADSGIAVHFFVGNHDIWTFGYLEKEIGLTVHREPELIEIQGKTFFLAHGDGLNEQSFGFRLLRKMFHNRALQKFFTYIPPRLGLNFGYTWAKNNRLKKNGKDYSYKGEDKEYLVLFAKQYAENHKVDYFIFGHRHIVLDLQLWNKSRVLIIGDWYENFTYAVFDGSTISLNCDFE
jgi:UDP-2,3-diacylglucosamine hydrolase